MVVLYFCLQISGNERHLWNVHKRPVVCSLRTADAFPVVASLPPKNSVCEPERQNDFRDVKPLVLM